MWFDAAEMLLSAQRSLLKLALHAPATGLVTLSERLTRSAQTANERIHAR